MGNFSNRDSGGFAIRIHVATPRPYSYLTRDSSVGSPTHFHSSGWQKTPAPLVSRAKSKFVINDVVVAAAPVANMLASTGVG